MRYRVLFVSLFQIISVLSLFSQDYDIPGISPVPSGVAGVEDVRISLDGAWKFHAVFSSEMTSETDAAKWSDIAVPGEWAMQGFHVDSGQAAAYFREFTVPGDWKDKRVKIRFNGVYSDSKIFINGKEAGTHQGGFTAFELDITDHVNYEGPNAILLSVTSESLADSLASGSRYACYPLGGITRSVYLFPLHSSQITLISSIKLIS